MLTSHLDAYISRYGDFCANDNNDDTLSASKDYLKSYRIRRTNGHLVCIFVAN